MNFFFTFVDMFTVYFESALNWGFERGLLSEELTGFRYHHLNHFSIFGSGYRGGAVSIMRQLIAKYGDFEESG